MEIIWNPKGKGTFKDLVLAIGVFDGVHRGHQMLLRRVLSVAENKGLIPSILTFDPHPLKVLKGTTPPLLTSFEERARLILSFGIRQFFVQDFQEIFQMSPQDFVEEFLQGILQVKALVVGEGYRFGRGAAGDLNLLKGLSKTAGFSVIVLKSVSLDGRPVRSTTIRALIRAGNVQEAGRLLGRPHSVSGQVVHGARRGRSLGIPTLNLDYLEEVVLPQNGVYCVEVEMEGRVYKGVANLGHRPTFGAGKRTLEVYVFDFDEEVYNKEAKVFFVDRIRDEVCFNTVGELVSQVKEDISVAKGIVSRYNGKDNHLGMRHRLDVS
jgi:riboflavin kinase/FMN adenylyltransferase